MAVDSSSDIGLDVLFQGLLGPWLTAEAYTCTRNHLLKSGLVRTREVQLGFQGIEGFDIPLSILEGLQS